MPDLIYDEGEIKRFLEKVLVPLEDDEVYILLLTARKKYSGDITTSQEVVSREIIRNNNIDTILRKIKKISRVDGIYVDKNTGNELSPESFVVYINIDPRSTLKGYDDFIKDMNQWTYENMRGDSKNLELFRKMDIKLFSAIHRSRSRNLYTIIDIDKKDETVLKDTVGSLGDHIVWITETRGGYHVIVKRNNDSGKIIYNGIRGHIEGVEVLKEAMTPICGTLQGGFKVIGIR